ncbi:MAG: hypothetical protein WCL30_03685 [Pseudomonadota bacterium]
MNYLTCSTYKIFTPQEAYSLDKKLDDGKPKTGFITNTTTPAVDDTTANSCITSVVDNNYNITNTDSLCSLIVKAGK